MEGFCLLGRRTKWSSVCCHLCRSWRYLGQAMLWIKDSSHICWAWVLFLGITMWAKASHYLCHACGCLMELPYRPEWPLLLSVLGPLDGCYNKNEKSHCLCWAWGAKQEPQCTLKLLLLVWGLWTFEKSCSARPVQLPLKWSLQSSGWISCVIWGMLPLWRSQWKRLRLGKGIEWGGILGNYQLKC